MSADQAAIADLDDIKLRLGFINGQGQQKGVDSLIVTDLIELARQKSISEAVLLSGDEDVRIGVQIAQNYGVRVHLLGIHPARGSQSPTLRQESDTTSEWDRLTVEKFLTVRGHVGIAADALPAAEEAEKPEILDTTAQLDRCAKAFVAELQQADLLAIQAFWKQDRGVPPEFDGKLLAKAAEQIERRLDRTEMRELRANFRAQVTDRLG